MPSITVKNIPINIYERLKLSAEINHRSINSEIIACIERAVSSQPLNPVQRLANARALRERTASYRISDEEFNQVKENGRI